MAAATVTNVPRFIVDLDAPPADMWTEIVSTYKQEMKAVEQQIEALLADQDEGDTLLSLASSVVPNMLAGLTHVGAVYYGPELKGIAATVGLPLGRLVLLQLVYEAAACCTSIVFHPTPDGPPVHARTMDWEMDFLRPLTIEVDFQREGETVFLATTWAGYVGVLTGLKPDVFSCSVNFRSEGGTFWDNLKKVLASAWPIGFLLRETLDSVPDYDTAVSWLANSELIAPVYFTVCGTERDQGVLLTRSRTGEVGERWTLAEHGNIAQANMDYFSEDPDEDVFTSMERRGLARALMDGCAGDDEAIFSLFSNPPIFNDLTVYCTIMRPNEGTLITRLPNDNGFEPTWAAAPEGGVDKLTCVRCNYEYIEMLNARGQCAHVGDWHDTYDACSTIKCAWGLKSKIGSCHWSCCFSVDRDSYNCPHSLPHTTVVSSSSSESEESESG